MATGIRCDVKWLRATTNVERQRAAINVLTFIGRDLPASQEAFIYT